MIETSNKPLLQGLTFIPLHTFVRQNLATELRQDTGQTKYRSKETLAQRILTDDKINGFVVQFTLKNQESGLVSDVNAGFMLYNESNKKITDMFTFKNGSGNNLFNRIVGYFMKEFQLEKIEIAYDDNNEDMKQFFEIAIEKPWDPLKNVVKPSEEK